MTFTQLVIGIILVMFTTTTLSFLGGSSNTRLTKRHYSSSPTSSSCQMAVGDQLEVGEYEGEKERKNAIA